MSQVKKQVREAMLRARDGGSDVTLPGLAVADVAAEIETFDPAIADLDVREVREAISEFQGGGLTGE